MSKFEVLLLLCFCWSMFVSNASGQLTDWSETISVHAGESVTLQCFGGVNNTFPVYWVSIKYRRFISRNENVYVYRDDWYVDHFFVDVDTEKQIYYLHIRNATAAVAGSYQCVTVSDSFLHIVLGTGTLVVIPSSDMVTNPVAFPPRCSATHLPAMMNMINIDEYEMELTCSWSAVHHPDARPSLYCNEQEILSKMSVGDKVITRVMLKNMSDCSEFTCKLIGTGNIQQYNQLCSVQNLAAWDDIRRGIRTDPMYSIVQVGEDATFLCIASTDRSSGSFEWNITSRLIDSTTLSRNTEVHSTSTASTLVIRELRVLTVEPIFVRCIYSPLDESCEFSSVALLTVIPRIPENNLQNKTIYRTDDNFRVVIGMEMIIGLSVIGAVLIIVILGLSIYSCTSESNNKSASPGSNNNRQRPEMPLPMTSLNRGGASHNNKYDAAKSSPGHHDIISSSLSPRNGEVKGHHRCHHSLEDISGREEIASTPSNDMATDSNGYLIPNADSNNDISIDKYVYATSDDVLGGNPVHTSRDNTLGYIYVT